MKKGKLIVLYGINNLGKSTQAKLLVEELTRREFSASYLKYPLYALEPSGPLLNDYLRKGNTFKFSAREFQFLQVLNRTQYDATLRERVAAGEWVVAEDYVGTGIAWGMGAGVDRTLLETLNRHLVKEDLGILFEGDRFLSGKEQNHRHETDDDLMARVKAAHVDLAAARGWQRLPAHGTIEEVQRSVWRIVAERFSL
ncbi:MAG: hypothetical protein A3B30_03530 [Candidatus Komeilibacteria bacterium RIFCSPLOWO2_01_FULL_52_15]|uniref:Thymidylate kinase-like domain-containing protein n=2 Tax=Candidatus Komeiliibacteriota TaxID=1817908 RepID=A0A1G2BS09_9BACT|nr:MAG: hypothetical protein A2677_00250 [Candidatus Komeilibacteria bacterium RIFCSPHIGHO2_01_FULL_52_14]OGY91832.1 MAG: hypothetical protein A3B30_03530 [Candidatus Komeilibacteria bacterium RIFCSPLOWO2_01_FULL_52_15]